MNLLFILLQAQDSTGGGAAPGLFGGGGLSNFILIGGIIAVFYLFMIRPQQKRQKEERKFREGLQKGDRVMTIGGIHGRIASVEENAVLVEVDNGVKLKMDKSAVKAAPTAEADKKK